MTAQGREHPGQQPGADDADLLVLDHANDLQTLRRYQETYAYDAGGNLQQISHQPLGAGPPGWTRNYHYATDSNRLLGTSLPGDPAGTFSAVYSHDAAGNMITMPHLAQLGWDHDQRFVFADRGGGGQVYFAYDATGRRIRKAYEHGGFVEERIYLDGYELYRNRNRTTSAVVLERQTLHVRDAGRPAVLVETKTIDTSIPGFTPTTRQRYQLADHLGSTAAELDPGGGVITYEEYLPYGGTSWQASTTRPGCTTTAPATTRHGSAAGPAPTPAASSMGSTSIATRATTPSASSIPTAARPSSKRGCESSGSDGRHGRTSAGYSALTIKGY